jgi:hypothetical protein
VKALVVLLVLAGAARAEPVREQVIGTQLLSIVGRGVSGSYERRIAERWSLVGLAGVRAAALVDFTSRTMWFGGEARFWIRGSTPMRGPFVALHASVGYTRLSDDEMGFVGSSLALSQRTDIGWRFTIRSRISIAPTIGIGTREDIDSNSRLATTVRPQLALGLEVGWLLH